MKLFKKKLFESVYLSLSVSRLYAFTLGLISIIPRFKAHFYCQVSWSAKIVGWNNIKFGRNSVVCGGSWLNVAKRETGKNIKIDIGENSFIGRNNFFTSGSVICIGAHCLTGPHCSFIGTSHVITNPYSPYISTGVSESWDLIVGVNCFFGFGASVLGNVRIGHGCVIGAHCTVMEDIPPFSLVVGNPGVVIKRYDFNNEKWTKDFDGLEGFPDESEYLKALEEGMKRRFPVMPLSISNDIFGDIL
jgi:acetyltransferase-like isoleucine patch superfamily enzyme